MNIRAMFCVLAAMGMTIAVSIPTFGNGPLGKPGTSVSAKSINWTNVEKLYVKTLQSTCDGVRISAANYIGEYRLEGAIPALSDMLASDVNECARYAAALALVQMGDADANEALDRAAKENGNANVAAFCRSLVYARGDNFKLPLRYAAHR